MSPPGLRQTAGVNDSIPRSQGAVCSQLLMLEELTGGRNLTHIKA
jgi:hypothetical protein